MRTLCCFPIIVLLLSRSLLAQDPGPQMPPDTVDVESTVEYAVDDLDAETGDPTQIAELLAELAAQPRNVNTASAEDLARIPSIPLLLARRIVRHRTTKGPFASLEALQEVDGMTARRLLRARPYLRALSSPDATLQSGETPYPSVPSLSSVLSNLDGYVMQRVERRLDLGRGYSDDTTRTLFVGSPVRLTTRIKIQHARRARAALTLDKDPGEAFAWEPSRRNYGFDHVSGSVALRDFGRLQSLIIGDFTAAFGQGVALWRGIAFGKSRTVVGFLPRSGPGLVPFASTEENRFFRGLATTVRITPSLSVSGFGSRRTLDATLGPPDAESSASGVQPAVTIAGSGLHRTPSEIRRKDALHETVWGGALQGVWDDLEVGGALYRSRFDRPVLPGDAPYKRFDFSGDSAFMASVFATGYRAPFTMFGELARAPSGSYGGVGGLTLETPRTDAVVVGRMYPRSFASLHGYAFGERNGATQNERGVYLGLQQRVAEDWTVAAYVDQYRFPWLRFGVPRPSAGIDARLVVEHTPRPWIDHYVQVRTETRDDGTEIADAGGRLLAGVQSETRRSVRWHGSFAFSNRLTVRTRVEATRVSTPTTNSAGALIYQDVRYEPTPSLQLDTRLAVFDTDDFSARVFAYEPDLLYAFSVPAFFGQGQRWYVRARFRPHRALTLEAKYSVTRFDNVTAFGSGLNETPGDRLRELAAQLRWQFGR